MHLKSYVLLGFLLLLAFDTLSQVGMKLAGDRIAAGSAEIAWLRRVVREPLIYAVLFCYLGAFATYTSLLRYAPVGPSYAAAHGHIVTVMLISLLFMGETFTLVQALGAAAILSGVAVLAVTEQPELPDHRSGEKTE